MRISSRRRAIAFFVVLGVCLVLLAVGLNVGWIILNWREGVLLFLGVIFFALLIAGMIVNTSFLVREIRRNEQHDSFINAVTHELKTPIASIRLYLQTLQHRDVDEAQRREFYRLMLDDTDRLMGTVDQVLKAGEAGHKRQDRRVPVDFSGLVRECVDVARASHHLAPESLRYEQSVNHGAAAGVLGDSEELRAAVSNLLDNAVKYSGEHVEILVRLDTPDEKRVTVSVRDRGVGIKAEELKRIFKRFYRVSNRSLSHVKGTGLGLFIVRAIARKHGGRVFAESEGEGHGTTVILELPRVSVSRVNDPHKHGIPMSHVLIVEDEAHLAKGLQYNLEAEGHSVAVVGDGERALDLLLGKSAAPAAFDAVVLDVMLPGKDGFTVAAELRAAKQYVPVLMLTARGRPEDVLKGFASGADDYLPKPFELPILLARLQGLLRRREWMQHSLTAQHCPGTGKQGVRSILFPRPNYRLRKTGITSKRKHHPVDSDGSGAAPTSHSQ